MTTFSQYLIEGYNPELWDRNPATFVWLYKGSPDDITPDVVRRLPWSRVVSLILHSSIQFNTVDMQLALLTNPNQTGGNISINAITAITDPKERKRILTDEQLMVISPDKYAEIVKEWFKDNTVLINKWLRYADNIRAM
jgi:hypothetical protein